MTIGLEWISQASWKRYLKALREINDRAYKASFTYLERYGVPVTTEDIYDFIQMMYAISVKYGNASAAVACQMYDSIAAAYKVSVPPAVPAATATFSETAKAVVGAAKTGSNEVISGAVARQVKMAGVDTTMQNAIRDGAEWAWIPVGETCAYCIALAGNGWQRASKKALKNGHAEHIHANCDCTYAVRFNSSGGVEGYDPDRWRGMYLTADLDGEAPTHENLVNALRRELYAENREKILAQKRSAYETSRALESSAAEEVKA